MTAAKSPQTPSGAEASNQKIEYIINKLNTDWDLKLRVPRLTDSPTSAASINNELERKCLFEIRFLTFRNLIDGVYEQFEAQALEKYKGWVYKPNAAREKLPGSTSQRRLTWEERDELLKCFSTIADVGSSGIKAEERSRSTHSSSRNMAAVPIDDTPIRFPLQSPSRGSKPYSKTTPDQSPTESKRSRDIIVDESPSKRLRRPSVDPLMPPSKPPSTSRHPEADPFILPPNHPSALKQPDKGPFIPPPKPHSALERPNTDLFMPPPNPPSILRRSETDPFIVPPKPPFAPRRPEANPYKTPPTYPSASRIETFESVPTSFSSSQQSSIFDRLPQDTSFTTWSQKTIPDESFEFDTKSYRDKSRSSYGSSLDLSDLVALPNFDNVDGLVTDNSVLEGNETEQELSQKINQIDLATTVNKPNRNTGGNKLRQRLDGIFRKSHIATSD
jgi:hypothetical protein